MQQVIIASELYIDKSDQIANVDKMFTKYNNIYIKKKDTKRKIET